MVKLPKPSQNIHGSEGNQNSKHCYNYKGFLKLPKSSECVRMHPNVSEHVQKRPEALENSETNTMCCYFVPSVPVPCSPLPVSCLSEVTRQ